MFCFALLWLGGNGGQNWLDSQYGWASKYPGTRPPSAEQVLKNAEGLPKCDGINLTDPEQRSSFDQIDEMDIMDDLDIL